MLSYAICRVVSNVDSHISAVNSLTVETQRAYFELKYFKIVKMRDAKFSLKRNNGVKNRF